MTRTPRLLLPIIVLALVALATPVVAKPFDGQEVERRFLSDKFYFQIGWFGADVNTDISFGFGNNLGTFLRLEDDLNLEKSYDTAIFEATWRFSRKHALMFNSTRLDRSGSRIIDKEFDIELPGGDPGDGLRFQIDGEVDSQFDNNIFGFIYRFSFYNNGKIDAGISAGLSFYDFDLALSGQAKIIDEDGNEEASTEFHQVSENFLAPIPTIGIHLAYSLSDRFLFRFQTNVLDLDIGDFEGRISLTKTTIEWFFVKHVSLGAGVTTNNIDVRVLGDDPVRVDYRYGGFMFFFAAGF